MSNTLNLGGGKWATKEGSLLAYNSENNNYKPLPFTFDRASSATRVNKQGLIETVGADQPRIDYLNDSKGALLLEPTRTNLVTQSNNTTTNVWSHFNFDGGIIVDTYGYPSPNGKNEASRLVYTNSSLGSGGALLTSNITLLATGVYTISLWAKSVSGTKEIRFSPKSTASAGPLGSRVTLTNQWKRYTHTFTNDGGADRGFQFRLLETEDSGDRTFDVWGMTIEEGSYETSTIPTSGSAVTRLAEDMTLILPDNASFNSSNGFSVISKYGIGAAGSGTSAPFIYFNDDTGNTYMGFGSNSTNLRCRLNLSGTAYLNTQANAPRTQENSLFVSCDANGWSQGANGVTNDTGNNDASVYDKLSNIIYVSAESYGIIRIKELSVYNTRLSNSELQELTQV